MSIYQSINIPIDLGKSVLSPECAYFLGAVFSADESFVFNEKKYWLAPVRHNYGQEISKEITEHMDLLSRIIGRANGRIMSRDELKVKQWFGSNTIARAFTTKQGFTALFESEPDTTIDSFIEDTKVAIDKSPVDVRQAFLVGFFDGRSAFDVNPKKHIIRYLALDCANHIAGDYVATLLEQLGIDFNYNTSRDRLEGGTPRKNQLRIPGNNLPLFMKNIGFVSPLKFKQVRSLLNPNLFVHIDNKTLWGLKTLSDVQQIEVPLKIIPKEREEYEQEIDNFVLKEITKDTYEGYPNFKYTGVPKKKVELVNGRMGKTYKRDRSVAINALVLAKHKCEIDMNHPSFIRKNSNLPYTEPHHLVPVGYYEMFDVSLDVEENIVSLCSTCHNQLHYGKEVIPLLTSLYEQRRELLQSVGIQITLDELLKMYNAR